MGGNGGSGATATSTDKRPNELLNSWFVRSGWSKGELARQVNRRARQLGANHISTDTSRVRRWLDGENPREPIPRILSELFSERFGCVVSVEDLGLRAARQSPRHTFSNNSNALEPCTGARPVNTLYSAAPRL